MGNSEEGKSIKPEKSSSPATDQNNAQVYPDWAAMQLTNLRAYYGPRLAVPPYFNPAVAAGHAPPMYMWGPPPQSLLPPYGAPYAAFCGHSGVYAHPGVPLAGTSFSMDTQGKSSGNTDGGLVKKMKEFDGLAISIGNGHADSAEGQVDQRASQSEETEDSSDESNGITAASGKKRSRDGSPKNTGNGKIQTESSIVPSTEVGQDFEKMVNATVPAVNVAEPSIGNVTTTLELKNTSNVNVKTSPTSIPQSCPPMPSEAWVQNERELKRERRKQSNRESARRSRLRKQAEAEELAMRVQSLTAENVTLKSEMNKLMENSKKLKLENATLLEKLKSAQLGQTDGTSTFTIDDSRMEPLGTVNLLARVNNSSDSFDKKDEENEVNEKNSSGAKLHQLLDTSPRTDPVAAR